MAHTSSLATLIEQVQDVLGEKKGAQGPPASMSQHGGKKRAALIKKLKKQKGVRDPEALATWIGLRKAGLIPEK